MTSTTRAWLAYTDGLLAQGSPAAEEIFTLMSIVRGPDYVRLANGTISPVSADRSPVKQATAAVIRATMFPNAAYSASVTASRATTGSQFVNFVSQLRGHGYSQVEAERIAEQKYTRPVAVKAGPAYNRGASSISARVLATLGEKSHFTLKVRKAAAILGIRVG